VTGLPKALGNRPRCNGGGLRRNSSLGSAYRPHSSNGSAGAIAGPLLALAVIGRFGMRGVFAFRRRFQGALCVIVAWLGIREAHRSKI